MKYFKTFFIITLIYLGSCTPEISDPEILPGSRDYQWSYDSIFIPFNKIEAIWGSSPDDIWGVGPGGSVTTAIWHYMDGKWKTDGKGRDIYPTCIFGFSKDNIWIAGFEGKIWHYNGSDWGENYQHTINGARLIITDLYGFSSNDLYAVGVAWYGNKIERGFILHYDGKSWEELYLAKNQSYFAKIRVNFGGECITLSYQRDLNNISNNLEIVYKFYQDSLHQIYNSAENNFQKGIWIETINGEIFLSLSDGIYKYQKDTLVPIYKYDFPRIPGCLIGRNNKDIFIQNKGIDKGIAHFNGTDIQLLCSLDDSGFQDGLVFENDVVMLVYNPWSASTFFYYGKKIK